MNENEEKAYRTQNNALDEVGKAMESFKLALGGMVQSAGNMIAPHFPPVDIRDYADHYLIDIDLPGIAKENVSLECTEHALIVKASRVDNEEVKAAGYIRKERGVSTVYRRIDLAEDADKEHIDAHLANGVLSVSIPKKETVLRKVDLK